MPQEVLACAGTAFNKAVMQSAYLFAKKAREGRGGISDLYIMEKMPIIPQELRDTIGIIAENASKRHVFREGQKTKPWAARLGGLPSKPKQKKLPAEIMKLMPGKIRY